MDQNEAFRGKRSVIFLRQEQNCTVYLNFALMATYLLCFVILFFFWLFFGFKWSYLYSIPLSLWGKVVYYSVKTLCDISVSESDPGHRLFSLKKSLHGLFLSTNGCRNLYESEKLSTLDFTMILIKLKYHIY